MRAAYDAAAAGWAGGPEQVYAPLARALVAAAPLPLAGGRVLDLGAGTGVAGRAALAAGAARVVAADLAVAMLRRGGPAQHPVAADATALPFRDQAFDLVVAAFCLNHLSQPGAALREARRVGRGLAASTFAPGWTHPAKLAVDEALRPFGFQPPAWYQSLQREAGRGGTGSGAAGRPGGRRRIHRRSGAHDHRPDRPVGPSAAGVVAAGHGAVCPVPAVAGRRAAGGRAARRRAGRGRNRAAGRLHAGPHRPG